MTRKIFIKLFFTFFISSFTYSTCAYAQETQTKSEAHTPWVLDTPPGKDQWVTEDTLARVVIFRLARDRDTLAAKPLNIFLNGKYHASLLPEHQAVALSLCPGKKELSVVPGDLNSGVNKPLRAAEETPDLEPGTRLSRLFMRAGQLSAWTLNQQRDVSRPGELFDEDAFFRLINVLLP